MPTFKPSFILIKALTSFVSNYLHINHDLSKRDDGARRDAEHQPKARETFQDKPNNAPRSADQVLNATKLGAAAMTVLGANLAEASTLGEE